MKPGKPDEYHSKENIIHGRNTSARLVQNYMKLLLKELPPETFMGKGGISNDG
jgi:hypothetical protein